MNRFDIALGKEPLPEPQVPEYIERLIILGSRRSGKTSYLLNRLFDMNAQYLPVLFLVPTVSFFNHIQNALAKITLPTTEWRNFINLYSWDVGLLDRVRGYEFKAIFIDEMMSCPGYSDKNLLELSHRCPGPIIATSCLEHFRAVKSIRIPRKSEPWISFPAVPSPDAVYITKIGEQEWPIHII